MTVVAMTNAGSAASAQLEARPRVQAVENYSKREASPERASSEAVIAELSARDRVTNETEAFDLAASIGARIVRQPSDAISAQSGQTPSSVQTLLG